jgi:hypothetical protein
MQQSSVRILIAGIFEACISPPNSLQMLTYTTLVEQVTAVLPNCTSLQNKLQSGVSSVEMQAMISRVLQVKVVSEHVVCRAYAASLHQQLVSATVALLLTLALTAQPTEPRMSLTITTALVNRQRQLPILSSQCLHEVPVAEPNSVSLFQQKNTPYTGQHLQDWRGRLKSELESQSFYQRDSIVRSVAQICQDLETRCSTVEEPLRREKEKSNELEQQVVELRERVASLEVQAADDRFHSEGLEDEKLNISDERDNLLARLRQVEAETSDAMREADDILNQTHEQFNAKELELRSTILTYEESIRGHAQAMVAERDISNRLRENLKSLQDEQTALSKQHIVLQHQLHVVEENLGSELKTARIQAEEITKLKDQIVEFEVQLQGTEAELDTITTRLSDVQVSHQELIHSSEEAYRDLEHRYTCDLETAVAKASNDCEGLNAQLQEATRYGKRIDDAHDAVRQELNLLQITIPPLEAKIEELTAFCTEQEEELDELRTLRKNVLASFNYTSQNPLAIRSSSRAQKDVIEPQTPRLPRERRRRKSALQTLSEATTVPKGTHGVTSTAMEHIANASFASSDSHSSQNGPTPKRAKPRPSFKVPAMHTPYTQKPIFASSSVSKKLSPIKRSALRQLSPNRRHTTVGLTVSENDDNAPSELISVRKRRGSLQGIEGADFDMEEFLAGTPLTPGNFAAGTGRVPDNDDETATEL